jgi:hypothetical protein
MTKADIDQQVERIKALETALRALVEKCDDFNAFWDDLDWEGVVNHAASSDLNTEHVLYFQTDFGTLDDGRPDTDEAKAALGGDA